MSEMNKQEFFNQVYVYAASMTKMSKVALPTGADKCLYRTPTGQQCLIGAFIPDDVYVPEMEGISGVRVIGKYPRLHEVFVQQFGYESTYTFATEQEATTDDYFVSEVQGCHDHSSNIHQMMSGLRSLAIKYDLTIPRV